MARKEALRKARREVEENMRGLALGLPDGSQAEK
jgi:hypothetical protein